MAAAPLKGLSPRIGVMLRESDAVLRTLDSAGGSALFLIRSSEDSEYAALFWISLGSLICRSFFDAPLAGGAA